MFKTKKEKIWYFSISYGIVLAACVALICLTVRYNSCTWENYGIITSKKTYLNGVSHITYQYTDFNNVQRENTEYAFNVDSYDVGDAIGIYMNPEEQEVVTTKKGLKNVFYITMMIIITMYPWLFYRILGGRKKRK